MYTWNHRHRVSVATVVPTCKLSLVHKIIVNVALKAYENGDWSPKIKVNTTENNAPITVAANACSLFNDALAVGSIVTIVH